jgi:hypothetical protein
MMGDYVVCDVCGQRRDMTDSDTFFFIGGPMGMKQLCSRGCLSRYVGELLRDPEHPIQEIVSPGNPS